jgi:hypothetical protein
VGSNTVWNCRKIPPFRRNILPPPSGLKEGCWEVDSSYRVWRRTRLVGIDQSELRNEEEMVQANSEVGIKEESWVGRWKEEGMAV